MSRVNNSSRQAGLTVIELMVGLAILGIIAAIAAPSFTGFIARAKLRGVANEAYADMQYARSESVQRNRVVRVVVSSTGYEIVLRNAANTGFETPALKSVVWTAANVTASSGSSMQVEFNPVRATAAPTGGPLVLSHASISGATVRVDVSASGRPELCSPGGTLGGVPSCS